MRNWKSVDLSQGKQLHLGMASTRGSGWGLMMFIDNLDDEAWCTVCQSVEDVALQVVNTMCESFGPRIIENLGTRPRKSPRISGSSESCTRGEMSPCSRARCALATDSQREGLSCGGSSVKNDARMSCSPSHK